MLRTLICAMFASILISGVRFLIQAHVFDCRRVHNFELTMQFGGEISQGGRKMKAESVDFYEYHWTTVGSRRDLIIDHVVTRVKSDGRLTSEKDYSLKRVAVLNG